MALASSLSSKTRHRHVKSLYNENVKEEEEEEEEEEELSLIHI